MGAAVERCCRPTVRTAGEQEGVGGRTGAKQPEGERRTPDHTLANRADREPPGRHESLSGLCSGCMLGMTREREEGEGNLAATAYRGEMKKIQKKTDTGRERERVFPGN